LKMRGSTFSRAKPKIAKASTSRKSKQPSKSFKLDTKPIGDSISFTKAALLGPQKAGEQKSIFSSSTNPTTSLFSNNASSSFGSGLFQPGLKPFSAKPANSPFPASSSSNPVTGPQPNYDLSKVTAGNHFSRNMYYHVKRVYNSNGKTYGDLESCDGRGA